MHRHHGSQIAAPHRGASVAIGNFDGVHRGHRAILDLAAASGRLGVLTFEPHPRQVFAPDAAPFRLMTAETRASRLEKLGVEDLFELPFTQALAGLSAEQFIEDVLIRGLGVSHVTVGADFRFGAKRAGDGAMLEARSEFGTTVARLVADGVEEVSSTAIRKALSEGRPEDAARMLGHWHRIGGSVETGFQRGRDMGFPTANLSLEGLHLPRFGVYAVTVDILTGAHRGQYWGAASVGVRPTFGGDVPNIETFLFDFDGDIYGERISVGLVAFQRPEIEYTGMDPLIAQMTEDCVEARRVLEAGDLPRGAYRNN